MDRRFLHNHSAKIVLGLAGLLLFLIGARFAICPFLSNQTKPITSPLKSVPRSTAKSEFFAEEYYEFSPASFPAQVVATSLRFEGPPLPSASRNEAPALPIEPRFDALATERLPPIETEQQEHRRALEDFSMNRLPPVEKLIEDDLPGIEKPTLLRLPKVFKESSSFNGRELYSSGDREVAQDDLDYDLLGLSAPAAAPTLPLTEGAEGAIYDNAEGERYLLTPLPKIDEHESYSPIIQDRNSLGDVSPSGDSPREEANRGAAIPTAPALSSNSASSSSLSDPAAPEKLEKPVAPHPISRGSYGPNPAMAAVSQRAEELTQHGFSLAQRGAFYSARAELIQALRLIAQALDAGSGGQDHSRHLALGLQALKEADDFAPQGSQLEADLDMKAVIASHRTPALKETIIETVSPLLALQRYYTFAQQELALASGHERSASQALYGLGKIYITLAEQSPAARSMNGPKAMAIHQAALTADPNNYLAANELGVLLAQYGQLQDARTVMLHCVSRRPSPQAWHNLSIIHQRLGEVDLARRSRTEWKLATQKTGLPAPSAGQTAGMVRWTSPAEFSASGDRPRVGFVSTPQPPPKTSNRKASWWNPMTMFRR